jgi:hypothetical protein
VLISGDFFLDPRSSALIRGKPLPFRSRAITAISLSLPSNTSAKPFWFQGFGRSMARIVLLNFCLFVPATRFRKTCRTERALNIRYFEGFNASSEDLLPVFID